MFAYYPRFRVVIVDNLTIDAPSRTHGAYYDFSTLLQECIKERCPDFNYMVAEITTDPAVADDKAGGAALIRLLRRIGFGRIEIKYFLPRMEARKSKKMFEGALMLKRLTKINEIRIEEMIAIHEVILFEHYLAWFRDFFGARLWSYEVHLQKLFDDMKRQIHGKVTLAVNGPRNVGLFGKRPRRAKTGG